MKKQTEVIEAEDTFPGGPRSAVEGKPMGGGRWVAGGLQRDKQQLQCAPKSG